MGFIYSQMYPTWQTLGVQYMFINYVSYGKAQMKFTNNKWVFTCQHGPQECLGNSIHTCANNIYQNNSAIFLDFLYCYADEYLSGSPSNFDVIKASQYCCSKYSMDFNTIYNCATGPIGNQLEHLAGLMTNSLNPMLNYVPWVLINGFHNSTIQNEAESNLLELV